MVSKLEHDIDGITQKMLLEHLKELIEIGLVEKKVYDGYPLKVEYYLTKPRGEKMLSALKIMREIGIDYMLEHNMHDQLKEKGLL